MTRLLCGVLLVCLVTAAGCGKAKPDLVPVKGRITYGGGDWPAAGTLYFKPKTADGNLPIRPGMATFAPDGQFVAKTGPREGLGPGTYALGIDCWESPPTMGAPGSGKSWVAPEYQQGPTSDFEIHIPLDSPSVDLSIDIPRRP